MTPHYQADLDRRFHLVVAGSAGGKVRSAVRIVARAALLSGLWAAQRDDYPITVRSGHSVSELVLSPEEIHYTGGRRPDALLLLSDDGRQKAARFLERMRAEDRLFALPSQAGVETRARQLVIDPARIDRHLVRGHLALIAVAAMLKELRLFPLAALAEAIGRGPEDYVEKNLEAIAAGAELP